MEVSEVHDEVSPNHSVSPQCPMSGCDSYKTSRCIDDEVGRLLNYLDDNDLTKNTMVIYTSDQGFFLG